MSPATRIRPHAPGLVGLLAASTVGVYLLLVVGASTALLEGALACPTWPACEGEWLVGPEAPTALLVAWLHRVTALVVGVLLLVTASVAWRRGATLHVRVAVTAALVLYPVQVALGALTALEGGPTTLSAVHLAVAMAIFSATVLALLGQLEVEVAADAPGRRGHRSRDLPVGTPGERRRTTDDEPAPATPSGGPDGVAPHGGVLPQARTYLELTKPKLWWLLCLVALAAMGIAGGRTLDVATVGATLLGGVLAIGASGTFNHVLERDVDRNMARTDDRPLVEGRVSVRNAVAFGMVLSAASVVVFVAFVNVLAAVLGVSAILFYSVGYTVLLKPHTTQNVVVGGAVGAFPALIGWAAVTNAVGMAAVVLGAVVFLWTPAHFYNLALVYEEDYDRAGIPMLPVVRGEAVTRRHVVCYLGATMLAAIVLGAVTRLDLVYAVTAATVGGVFVRAVVGLYRERTRQAAWRTFHASNAYLGALLVAIVLDSIVL